MKRLWILLLLSSCTYSDSRHNVAFGGKGAYQGRDFSVTWDNEKSFSDGSLVAGIAIGAVQAVAAQRSTDAVSRAVDANRSAETINASNNAVKTAEIGAGVTKSTTLNPNIIPK